MTDDTTPDTATTVWRRWFDIGMGREPAPRSLAIASGVHLAPGRYVISLEPVDGAPSAYRVNDENEQIRLWNTRLYIFLPTADGHYARTAIGPGAQDTREEAYAAFNALPETSRTFTLSAADLIVFHPGFDYRDNEGKLCVVITKKA